MKIIKRSIFLLLIYLLLIGGSTWAVVDSGQKATSNDAKWVIPPPISSKHLACSIKMEQQPHIKLMAKTKQQDQYGTIKLGCIPVATETQALLDDNAILALEDAVTYLAERNSVIRVYIDIAGAHAQDATLQTRYRKQAFAIKQYLTQKGVYAHLKKVRKKHFNLALIEDKKKEPKKKIAKKTIKKPAKIKLQPAAPVDEYAYHTNKSQRALGNAPIAQYSNQHHNNFEFVPLESIYFPHNQYKLTKRAKATLDDAASYILETINTTKVIIEAHANHHANRQSNYQLTDRRALATRDYLLTRGVPIALLEISSKGETSPVDESWTRSGQARNRRVTLYVIAQLASNKESRL